MKQGIVFRAEDSLFSYQGWPTVCRDARGTLYAVFSGHRIAHLCPFGMNLLCTSTDLGNTWSAPMIVNDTFSDDRDAGIVSLGGNKLLMSYFNHPFALYEGWREWLTRESDTEVHQTVRLVHPLLNGALDTLKLMPESCDAKGSFLRLSEDNGRTWEKAIRVPVTAPHGPVKTASGRLLYAGKAFHTEQYKAGEMLLFESTDDGRTWEFLSHLPVPKGVDEESEAHEAHLTETSDKTLIVTMRVHGKNVPDGFSMAFSRSHDGGRTWDEPNVYPGSGSPPHLLTLSGGRVLLTFARRHNPMGVRAAVSLDDCRTFQDEIVLSESKNADIGYASTAVNDDGTLVTVYYQHCGQDRDPSILYTKWEL